ncbi:ABC transporter substrate-binding protein [Bacillus methanolicus]|uniref:Putative ABC transporter substrate-binding lipoprotein YvrC n=1 Tax=Bacillus methanolicus (strain MGA3 / ATCC 53907) TaxID=796606 RepID=I3E3U8_BACMM|nr:ABC transporter substrate-binding protein [Bacillus methanolicus]AIE58724.1 putative ABC transporter substrate-binding lipoprotein YvrC [Bacillus methanolicus MGA3]EIJ81169.1 periplasmic binding protein [Bacillus methanolicus MGA3]
MKKLFSLFLAMLLAAGILAGCGGAEKPVKDISSNEPKKELKSETEFPVKIKDATGKEVVIESKPERIVSLIPSNTEIAFALGLGKEIVGVSDNDNYPKEVTKKEKIGGMQINVEKVISLKPNLVLAHPSIAQSSKEGLQQLKDAGIPVLVVNDAQNFEQVYESIKMIGTATGEKDEAEKIIQNMKERIAKVKEKASKIEESKQKTVYVEVSPAPEIYTPGKNTFMNEMLSIINAKNVFGDLEGWAKIDQEAVIKKNPDVIVTTYGFYVKDPVGNVTSRKGWENIKAVKNKQVVDVNSDLVSRPGPRLAEGVEELAKAVYPEIFAK